MTYLSIRKNVRIMAAAACVLFMSAHANAVAYFGYAPLDPDIGLTSALGSGKNGYTEAAITLDPASNPVVKALKGSRIIGVRCYMRADYRQKNKKTSAINIRTGAITDTPVKNYADLLQGWNEIMLDTPVEIGDSPIFIGPMVYETSGNPYPFVSAHGPGFDGGLNVSLNKEPWQQYASKGNLLMQVILDRQPEDMPLAAQAALSGLPLVVEPGGTFNCDMAIHNFSGIDIDSVELTIITDNSTTEYSQTVNLDSPVPPSDTRVIGTTLAAGVMEDPSVGYSVMVTGINGMESVAVPVMGYNLHVTRDAFLRIPLVEEFTSQNCTNCPFMMYYIDRAMEEFARPHVYMTRHSGFVNDSFSIREDNDLLYLFGTKETYNPAVMYDRTIFDENGTSPVTGASVASTAPYLDALNLAAVQPALAKIIVDQHSGDGYASCTVSGRIANGIDTGNLFVCAYLIENDIPRDKVNFQLGIDDAPDDAPEDLAESFRHNGIIRIKFHNQNLGDLLEVNPDTREFSVDFGPSPVKDGWVSANCETVAFICRINKDNLADNMVLNAGGSRWNKDVGGASVNGIDADMPGVKVMVGADRMVRIAGDYVSADIHSVSGQKMDLSSPLPGGVYVVRTLLADGRWQSTKIAVR